MNNDILDYCISLREKGLDSDAIRNDLENKGLNASEIKELIRGSDLIFLDNAINFKQTLGLWLTDRNSKNLTYPLTRCLFN